jgi:hypothetical protein
MRLPNLIPGLKPKPKVCSRGFSKELFSKLCLKVIPFLILKDFQDAFMIRNSVIIRNKMLKKQISSLGLTLLNWKTATLNV